MRHLAIDFGVKRIGLAVCDSSEKIVSPLETVNRKDDAQSIRRIAKVIADEGIEAVVVGLPVNMNGSEGPQARRTREFADLLAKSITIPLHFQNEQLSSFAADDRLAIRELTKLGARRRQDAVAAAIILAGFLDARRR